MQEVNALQWEITFNQVKFKNVEQEWELKYNRYDFRLCGSKNLFRLTQQLD